MIAELRISDLGEIITGNTPPTADRSLYDGRYPLIMPTDIVEGEKYIGDTEETVSDKGFIKYRKSIIPKDTPCVVTIGSIGKKICLSKEDSFTNQAINAVKVHKDKYDPVFVFYLLKYNLPQVKNLSSGTASGRENVSKSSFAKIKVKLLKDLPTQKKIASILSAYDDLIEINNQRIQLLKEIAEEIYKEWFVRMRFPGYQDYKFYDKEGKEVAHGTQGALPGGWDRVQLGEVIAPVKRKPKVKKDQYLTDGSIPVIDQGDNLIAGYVNDVGYKQTDPLPVLIFGDHTRRVKYVNFPFACGADGTQLIYPKNQNLLPTYFYLAVKGIDLSNFHYSRHFKFLKSEHITIPDDQIVIKYNELTSNFLEEIDVLRNKNQILKETRDLLLPRLISGKMDVSELAINEVTSSNLVNENHLQTH